MSLSFEDRRIQALGKIFQKIYSEAQKGMAEKVNSFFANFKELDAKKKALVDAGKLAQKEYDKWRQNKLLVGEKYKDLRDSIADNMLHANERAAAVINHELPNVYSHNYNQVGEGVERKVQGYSFDLTSPETVRKLATDKTTLLPYKFIDGRRDVRWNSTKVNAQILQGILQGESADQMAQRLMNISVMNQESALRNARTAVTSAQNKGRMDAMKQCEDDGVIMYKEWIATKDERTREAHEELDRVQVPYNEPFENSIGQIMYPGDPDADPSNTYNCRCTIAEVVKGFKLKEKEEEIEIDLEKDSKDHDVKYSPPLDGETPKETKERNLEALGYNENEIHAVDSILDRHSMGGELQDEADAEIIEHINADDRIGQLLSDKAELEAQAWELHVEETKEQAIKDYNDKVEDAKRGLAPGGIYQNYTEEDLKDWGVWPEAPDTSEPKFYRKGDMDSDVLSFSKNSRGAGMSFLTDGEDEGYIGWNVAFTLPQLEEMGYKPIAGIISFDVGMSGEAEALFAKFPKR